MSNQVHTQEFWFNLSQAEWHTKEIKEIFSKIDTPMDIIIDIGANMGASIRFFHAFFKSSTIIAIEPDEDNAKIIQDTISTAISSRLLLFKAAIYYSDKKQLPAFDAGDGNSGGLTIIPEMNTNNTGKMFDITTLENILRNPLVFMLFTTNKLVTLAKIDVEGSEYNIIENSPLIKTIPWLFVEWHDSKINTEEFIAKHLPDYVIVCKDSRGSTLLKKV